MTEAAPPADRREIIVAHASDLHVDNDYTAALFGGDGTAGLRAVLTAAQKAKADLLLLAGDTFDSHRVPVAIVTRAAELMREFALPTVMLPGNHDPAVDDAVYRHPIFKELDFLHILGLTHAGAVQFPHLDLEVWGLPHSDYFDMDPLANARPRTTRWQIAMAHGHYLPVPDRSIHARPSWLIGDAEIESTKADYIALGHWHRREKVGNGEVPAWYCGSPDQARSINVVRLSAGATADIRTEPLLLPEDFGGGPI